jgi:hypothetical protein
VETGGASRGGPRLQTHASCQGGDPPQRERGVWGGGGSEGGAVEPIEWQRWGGQEMQEMLLAREID